MKERIKNILHEYEIGVLNNEKEILDTLDELIDKEEFSKEDMKNLDHIERYLKIKAKMMQNEVAYNFLSKLAKNINTQKKRKEDRMAYQVNFFMVKDKEGNSHFKLTREAIELEIENNKERFVSHPTINVISQNNSELYELLEIIEKIF